MLLQDCILEINDDMSELEKFVRQEAMNYVETTCFLSCLSSNNKYINNVVERGKEITPYVFKLFKEMGENSSQNMYTHFFLFVMERLYGPEPFEGYVGIPMCVRYWLKREKHGLLDNKIYNKTLKANTEETTAELDFLCDLFETNEEELKNYIYQNGENKELDREE